MSEAKKPNAFVGFFKKIAKFLRDCKGEIKKVVWPTPKQVFKNMGVVLAAVVAIGLFVFGLDTVFMQLLNLVMDIAV